MRGKSENPAAVGPDLTDNAWIHGGTPKEIYVVLQQGVALKGMPAWEPILGQKKTAEVVAYVLSRHKKGDPIVVEASK
jgi:cytochrome c oxidase cbb3-type subunit 3